MRSPEELQHTYPAMDGESHRGHEIFLCRKGMVEALRWVRGGQVSTEYEGRDVEPYVEINVATIDAKLAELEGE